MMLGAGTTRGGINCSGATRYIDSTGNAASVQRGKHKPVLPKSGRIHAANAAITQKSPKEYSLT